MRKKQRRVLLVMDNCSAHDVTGLHLKNVNIQFLPPNSTSRLQPLDQGIIALFKRDYRKRLVRAAISAAECNQRMQKWNVLDAMRATILSWNSVEANHIKNCFTKAWSSSNEDNSILEVLIEECEEWDYLLSVNTNISRVSKYINKK